MTVTARRTPHRDTMPGTYVCARCGVTKRCNDSRTRPIYCRDCTTVDRALTRTPR